MLWTWRSLISRKSVSHPAIHSWAEQQDEWKGRGLGCREKGVVVEGGIYLLLSSDTNAFQSFTPPLVPSSPRVKRPLPFQEDAKLTIRRRQRLGSIRLCSGRCRPLDQVRLQEGIHRLDLFHVFPDCQQGYPPGILQLFQGRRFLHRQAARR